MRFSSFDDLSGSNASFLPKIVWGNAWKAYKPTIAVLTVLVAGCLALIFTPTTAHLWGLWGLLVVVFIGTIFGYRYLLLRMYHRFMEEYVYNQFVPLMLTRKGLVFHSFDAKRLINGYVVTVKRDGVSLRAALRLDKNTGDVYLSQVTDFEDLVSAGSVLSPSPRVSITGFFTPQTQNVCPLVENFGINRIVDDGQTYYV